MQITLAPIFKKFHKDIPLEFSFKECNLLEALILIELELRKYLTKQIPLVCINKFNDIISNMSNTEDCFLKPVVAVSSGKNMGVIIGALMVVVGVVVGAIASWAGPGLGFAWSMIISGIGMILADVLSPKPVIPAPNESDNFESAPSYNFSNFANKIGESNPVPVVYGYQKVAGVIIDYIEDVVPFYANAVANRLNVSPIVTVAYSFASAPVPPDIISGGTDSPVEATLYEADESAAVGGGI